MTKKIFFLITIIGLFFSLSSCDNLENDYYIIKSGTSFGNCIDYCITEITIDSSAILFSEKGWNTASTPEKKTELSISRDQYSNLCSLIDLISFSKLEEKIGCPDCYDQGAEWIEIITSDFSKKVLFSYGETVKGIEGLQNQIREIRQQFIK